MDEVADESRKWVEENSGSMLFDLWLLQQALYPLIENAISGTGLSADEYGFYLLMSHVHDVTPGDIARMTGMRPNTTSAALARLEKRGHLIRTPNERDRRSVLVRLSPEGWKVCEEAMLANEALHDRLMAATEGTGIEQAIAQLERIVRELANMPRRPGTTA